MEGSTMVVDEIIWEAVYTTVYESAPVQKERREQHRHAKRHHH